MHKNSLKLTSVLFVLLITLSIQSCKVYDKNVPEVEAVASSTRVKVITTNGKTYDFEKLLIEEDQLVGISKPKSKEAKHLPSEKYVNSKGDTKEKISINRETIKTISVYDERKSKRRSIWLVVGISLGTLFLAAGATAAVAVASA